MSTTGQKRAAYAILQFLEQSLRDGSIRTDDAEGIEVASQFLLFRSFDFDCTSRTISTDY